MTERTFHWSGKTRPISAPHVSDEQVAVLVRMLTRDDLSHESVVTAARDRIMCLLGEKNNLLARLAAANDEIERLRAEIDASDPPLRRVAKNIG